MAGSQPIIGIDNQLSNPPLPERPPPLPAPGPGPSVSGVAAVAVTSSTTPPRAPEHLMHKNRLQEYTQRSSIALPVYQTFNEGFQHAPKFRSTVLVDGESYTSSNTFSHRKAAEQDVAKLALECISKKIKDEGCPLISEDTIFCKSILNEFAVKTNVEKPTYNTIQPEGTLPVFISSLVFNGVTYTGEAGKCKKEAEQFAARAVIRTLLGSSGFGTILFEIIKSKVKLFAALRKVKDFNFGSKSAGVNTGQNSGNLGSHVVETATLTENVPTSTIPGTSSGMPLPHHQFKITKLEQSSETVNLPISFVPPVLKQPSEVGPSTSKKRRKNKKKANKRFRPEDQLSIVPQPFTQAPPCSVVQ